MRPGRPGSFRPFASGGGRTIGAILATFALMFALSLALSIIATSRSHGRAALVEVAARQRTLAERYVQSILLVRSGRQADPATLASLLSASSDALLEGGTVPEVPGDDDETTLSRASSPTLRAQLTQERRLVSDLTATGAAYVANQPLGGVQLSANETIATTDPLQRLRVLAALTSNVALDVARTIAAEDDQNISGLIAMEIALGVGGLLLSLLLAWGLVAITRRRTVHFRSLVQSSTDLVVVLGAGGCRYASRSLSSLTGRSQGELLRGGFEALVHEDDRGKLEGAREHGEPRELILRLPNAHGEWRYLEAHVTDLRHDRHVAGVVLNARDITERLALERQMSQQAERDRFGSQLVEALEMADEEGSAYEVIERAMSEVDEHTPMELLLSDSSRARLKRVASSPSAGSPACPVQSPFSCAAVRRGSAAVFQSSESLNACPKLRGRKSGPCSAACVPVGFMGRALGVLHVTGPAGQPPDAETLEQLKTLAAQAGNRIGTVRAFEKTQLQAATDSLTGLPNRRTAQTELRALVKGGYDFALAFADLDAFKQLNDKHGHDAGDRALRLFSQVCQSVLRERDIVARWGGEEFMLVLPALDAQRAVAVLERLRERLAESHLGEHPRFTASFGVTDSREASTMEQLVQIADAALYASKAAGRDRITTGSALPDLPDLLVPDPVVAETLVERVAGEAQADAAEDRGLGEESYTRPGRAALHAAADEEEPSPNGIEIR